MRSILRILLGSIVGCIFGATARHIFPSRAAAPVVVHEKTPAHAPTKPLDSIIPAAGVVQAPAKAPDAPPPVITVLFRSASSIYLSDGTRFVVGETYGPNKKVTRIENGVVHFSDGVFQSVPRN